VGSRDDDDDDDDDDGGGGGFLCARNAYAEGSTRGVSWQPLISFSVFGKKEQFKEKKAELVRFRASILSMF